MISKGNVSLTAALADCDMTGGSLTSQAIKDRKPNPAGGISLVGLRGTVTGMHVYLESSWNGAMNRRNGQKATFATPAYKEAAMSTDYARIYCSRYSDPDCGTEVRFQGKIPSSGTYYIQGEMGGYGSTTAKSAQSQVAVVSASSNYLSGTQKVDYNNMSYSTYYAVPCNATLTLSSSRPFISVIIGQYCFGPDHQPPTDGISVINQRYHTGFRSVRMRG